MTNDYLIDTHALLWISTDDSRLTDAVRKVILSETNVLWVSTATVWELAIKKSLEKLEFSVPLEAYLETQRVALAFKWLPIRTQDALKVEELPWHHRDPFDRLLIAQALGRKMTILSRDRVFHQYSVKTIWHQ